MRGAGRAAEQPVTRHLHCKHPLGLNSGFYGFAIPAFLKWEIKYQLGMFSVKNLVLKN